MSIGGSDFGIYSCIRDVNIPYHGFFMSYETHKRVMTRNLLWLIHFFRANSFGQLACYLMDAMLNWILQIEIRY
jgi:hypothetical protein